MDEQKKTPTNIWTNRTLSQRQKKIKDKKLKIKRYVGQEYD